MASKPMKNEIYKHFKGKYYQVEAMAVMESSGEEMVVYRQLYGNEAIFIRPLEEFLSDVDSNKYPDALQRKRFQRVSLEEELTCKDFAHTEGKNMEANAEADIRAVIEANAEVPDAGSSSLQEGSGQEKISEDVLRFLDAKTNEEKLEVLYEARNRITDDMISTMAMGVGVEIADGDLQIRYQSLNNSLLTYIRYEGSRLR